MVDNSNIRKHDVFFYGLYMDPDVLSQVGVEARNPRIASINDFALAIGNKATLLRAPGQRAHGVIYALTHAEIHQLYWGAGLDEYAAEALLADVDGVSVPVLCCNLITPPAEGESNPDYEAKLRAAKIKLGVPGV